MTPEEQIMQFLNKRVFSPILNSNDASPALKSGVRYTIMRMNERDAPGMIDYFWSAMKGTPRSIGFAAKMEREGFDRFEEVFVEFRLRFGDDFLRDARRGR